jgi:hypothetical protein
MATMGTVLEVDSETHHPSLKVFGGEDRDLL